MQNAAGVPPALIGVSKSSLNRWNIRLVRRRRSGGRTATRFRNGDLALLILFREAHRTATADEVITYIANNSATGRIYSRPDITWAETKFY